MDVGEDEFWMNSDPDEEGDASDSEQENAYYEAKSLLQEDRTEASVRFQEVILMDAEKGQWGLKALKQLIKLKCQQGHLKDAIEHHLEVVGYAKSVSGKALEKALHKILVCFSTADAVYEEKNCVLESFIDSLEPLKENRPSAWCQAMLGVGRHYITTKNFVQAKPLTERVLDFCMCDSDEMRARRQLPEVFELQAHIAYAVEDYDSVVKLRQRAQPYADAVCTEKPMCNIRELTGLSLLRLSEFSKAEDEFKDLVRDNATVPTEERKRHVDSFVAAYFLRRCFASTNATISGWMLDNKCMAIDDDGVLEIAKDHMDRVQMVAALVKALGDDDLHALEVALDTSVGRLDPKLVAIFQEWHRQIRDLRDRFANARTRLARGDLPFIRRELPELEQLIRTVGGSSEFRQANHMMDVLALKAHACFEERNYELLKVLCETANKAACTADKDLQRASIIEFHAKGQLLRFTADITPTVTRSSAFNDTFYAASKMYAKASPEQAEMCALYSVLVDGLHGLGEWQEWATYSEHYGTYLRERQMVDEFSTAYKRGDIATLSNVRMELAAATSDTFLHEQLCRLELKLRRRLCLRTITFPAETWTVVFEYLHHRECHAPHEASRNFRNILAPILRHPNILTVVEVAITSSSFEFYGCTAIVRTVECGDKASGGPKSLFRAIDFVARLTSLHRVKVMHINADEYLSPALLSKFRRYFGSVNVDRLSVDRMDFTTSRLQCTNESWDDEPLTSDSLYDSDDDRDTLLHFIDSLKSIDEVCLEQRCKLSSGQVNDALMGGCRAKRIHHLDLRCAPSFGLTYEVTDAGLIEFCVGGEGDGRARYLSICCPSISDDFFLHLHKAHRNAEHQDPFVLRIELDPHEIETIQKLVQQVETSANLSPERDADQNGGAMRLTVEYGLPDTDDPPKPSRFVTIARS